MAAQYRYLGLCPADMEDCVEKCKIGTSYVNCEDPCDCFESAEFDPASQQCRTNCDGFGGSGDGNCTGVLQIQYGVRRQYRLAGDLDALNSATVKIAGGPPQPCTCPTVRTCDANYQQVLNQIGTTEAPAAVNTAFSSNIFSYSIGENDPVPKCGWYESFGPDGNVFNATSTACQGGSGSVMYKWWPYITFNDVFSDCGGCQDPFNSGTCGISFELGCAPPYCACCCGCEPCNYNNFGEATCDSGSNFYLNSGGKVMNTEVVILYRWISGPNANFTWYRYIPSKN